MKLNFNSCRAMDDDDSCMSDAETEAAEAQKEWQVCTSTLYIRTYIFSPLRDISMYNNSNLMLFLSHYFFVTFL